MGDIVKFLTLPNRLAPARGTIYVLREEDGCWLVEHESAGGGSWGNLGRFHSDKRPEAIRYACSKLEEYPDCNLRIADIDPPATPLPPPFRKGGPIEF